MTLPLKSARRSEVEGEALEPLVDPGLVHAQVGLPERHPAADVVADQMGIDEAAGMDGRADGNALAGMQVGHAHGGEHAGQFGGFAQLLNGRPLDPTGRGGVKANGVAEELRINGKTPEGGNESGPE